MKIDSKNEWDPLRVCIVGDVTGARFPEHDEMHRLYGQASSWRGFRHPRGPLPQGVLDETREDLQTLCAVLEKLGVQVFRPEILDFSKPITTYDWTTDGMYNYCPRDVLLVIGNMVIEAPMALRARQAESIAYTEFKRSAIRSGARWISAPRPRLLLEENRLVDGIVCLTEEEPIFDASNVCRLGRDILYLVSCTGNRIGGQWLANVLGPDYRVHILEGLYQGSHIDTTILPLREGTVLLNASRITEQNCPSIFAGWEKIWVHGVVPQPLTHDAYAGKWIALNVLSVDPSTIIVDRHQKSLIQALERTGFTVIPLELRHARTLGGGFHCVTLDVVRARACEMLGDEA